ncbi:MAG TPA: tetratricopeptide repeat protein, partial [Gemmataceae bacterium]|nr:tetratricopeptide repeat protein [Gemmataceae bacterium]
MIRRWLRGCLLPSALCLSAVGCTTSVESLTGGLVTSGAAPTKAADPAPPAADGLAAPEQLRLHLDTARQLDQGGNDEGALVEYERILALDRANYTAMRRLAVLYDRRGGRDDFKKAEELYRKVADARPKDPDVWSDWGYSLFLRTDKETCKENWAEAEKKLRQAIKLDPQHARAHTNLGLVLGQLDRYDEAYREFRAAKLNDGEAHCDMAFVYWQK